MITSSSAPLATVAQLALWESLRKDDGVGMRQALAEGADPQSPDPVVLHTDTAEAPITPLQFLVQRHMTLGKRFLRAQELARQRERECTLLDVAAPEPSDCLVTGQGLLFQALFHQAIVYHDQNDPAEAQTTADHMGVWLAWAQRHMAPSVWHHDAVTAWRDFVDLYGQDSEGLPVPLVTALAEPMMLAFFDHGVTAQELLAVPTPRFDALRLFPDLERRLRSEERHEYMLASTPIGATSRPSGRRHRS